MNIHATLKREDFNGLTYLKLKDGGIEVEVSSFCRQWAHDANIKGEVLKLTISAKSFDSKDLVRRKSFEIEKSGVTAFGDIYYINDEGNRIPLCWYGLKKVFGKRSGGPKTIYVAQGWI